MPVLYGKNKLLLVPLLLMFVHNLACESSPFKCVRNITIFFYKNVP